MRLFNTTKKWTNWWTKRKIDWNKQYTATWNHPHRSIIVKILKNFNWLSLFEIGCGSGPNLINIIKGFPNVQVGGIDPNPDAIATANKTFNGGMFKVGSGEDVMLSDKSTDISLSDMTLIYVGPLKIDKHISEIKRITRNYVILCEFHSDKWWKRLWLKIKEGYFAYDWVKLLSKHGFYDIVKYKMTKEDWPESTLQQTFGHIIFARVPKL